MARFVFNCLVNYYNISDLTINRTMYFRQLYLTVCTVHNEHLTILDRTVKLKCEAPRLPYAIVSTELYRRHGERGVIMFKINMSINYMFYTQRLMKRVTL